MDLKTDAALVKLLTNNNGDEQVDEVAPNTSMDHIVQHKVTEPGFHKFANFVCVCVCVCVCCVCVFVKR